MDGTRQVLLALLLSIIALGVIILAQIILSRNKNKFLGLIMPALTFLITIMLVISIVMFSERVTTTSDGIVISRTEVEDEVNYPLIFGVFFIGNIPTIMLGSIYFKQRKKLKEDKSMEELE